MNETMVTIDGMLMGYLLFGMILLRCSGLVVFAPFFGADHFPMRTRIGISVAFAILLFPVAKENLYIPEVLDTVALGLLAMQELAIGLTMGFLAGVTFMGVQLAGQLMGMQMGFAMANVVDPILGQEISILGFFKMNLAIVLFLAMNLHMAFVYLLKISYEEVGVGALSYDAFATVGRVASIQHGSLLFVISVKLALPVLLIMLLNSVVEGFVTRTMPQMNIMVLGLPLRVTLGMLTLCFVTPALMGALSQGHENWLPGGEGGILHGVVDHLLELIWNLGGAVRDGVGS